MANKGVQFQSNTKKYLEDSLIKGSNEIYYFIFPTGAYVDLRTGFENHCINVLTKNQTNGEKNSNIGPYVGGIFRRDINPYTHKPYTDKEFIEAINDCKIGPLGNTYLIPRGRDFVQVDQNGNIILASLTSCLENKIDGCGNILINGQTGETIRKADQNVIINTCQKSNGFYPIEVYTTNRDRFTGKIDVVDRKYNFLTPEGKRVSPHFNFPKVPHEEKCIYSFSRNFYSRHNGKVLNDWDIYPQAYVYCYEKTPYFFNGECELLQANRRRVERGLEPIVEEEIPYIVVMYERLNFLDQKIEELGKAFDDGAFNQAIYDDAMRAINKEYNQIEEYIDQNKTFLNSKIRENLDQFKKLYPVTPTVPVPTKDNPISSNPSDDTSDKELDR